MVSAISFGVFCRKAPSTRAIIRSRKVEPWPAVILTLIQSEMTSVPPVTAERSPPDSRMTGADSPVIAASLTEATPSTTSPSPGIRSSALTSTRSPGLRLVAATSRHAGASARSSSLATVEVRALRRLAACALPRPSATASAKFANRTVNHSHKTTWNEKPSPARPKARSRRKRSVVSVATTSTTNMTGLRIISRGSSFATAVASAGRRILPLRKDRPGSRRRPDRDAALIRVDIAGAPNRACRPASRNAPRAGRTRGRGRR